MKITAVITTHRRPHMIVQCLESVLNQTRPVDEIVIVDDNAELPELRTKTKAAVDALRIGVPLRYLVPEKNIGHAAARNHALETVMDGWVAFLDDDDSWEPNKLEHFDRVVEASRADVVFSDYTTYDGALSHPFEIVKMPPVTASFFDDLWASNVVGPPSTVMVRREKCLLFDEKFSKINAAMEDYDWYLRMASAGAVFQGIPIPLMRYRCSPSGRYNSVLEPWVRGSRLMYRRRFLLADSPARKNLARRVYYGDLIHYALRLGNYGRFVKLTAGYLCRFGADRLLLKRFRNFIVNRLKAFRS